MRGALKLDFLKLVCLFIVMTVIGCASEEVVQLIPKDYATWVSTVEEPLTYRIPGHTSLYRVIYINEIGTQVSVDATEGGKRYEYPPGTIIAKASHPDSEGKEEPDLTVMIKKPDHPQALSGWIYLSKDAGSDQENIFSAEFCIDCHTNANERHPYGDKNRLNEFRDFVFFPFTKPAE